MTTLEASGRGVGLPAGQMGNSEVGHMTIGSGTIVKQDLVRIDDAIEDGSFFENPALLSAVAAAREAQRPLHLIGLVSDGGVHSHIDHLGALIRLCHRHQVVPQVHMITDGRDTAPQAALSYLPGLEALLDECGGHIGTISGRYYAMDPAISAGTGSSWPGTISCMPGVVSRPNRRTHAIEQSYAGRRQ